MAISCFYKERIACIWVLISISFNAFTVTFTPTTIGELKLAISTANTNGVDDVIDLGGFIFSLNTIDNVTNGDNGLPAILSDNGSSLDIVNGTIERQAGSPEFRLIFLQTGATISLDRMTLRGGSANDLGSGSFGGALLATSARVEQIANCTFSGNTSSNQGGAIFLSNSTIGSIYNTTFANNSVAVSGGAIFVDGTSRITILANSTISSNSSSVAGGGLTILSGGTIGTIVSTIIDVLDNCPLVTNSVQEDRDGDGIGDLCDLCTDSDGDGFGDHVNPPSTCALDNCPFASNAEQADRDQDGVGDACDLCDGDTCRIVICNDSDSDQHCDEVDNCVLIANPWQTDRDGDAVGDACDPCTDIDGDGFGDDGYHANTCALDNCEFAANPDQEDEDRDGIGDACESEHFFDDHDDHDHNHDNEDSDDNNFVVPIIPPMVGNSFPPPLVNPCLTSPGLPECNVAPPILPPTKPNPVTSARDTSPIITITRAPTPSIETRSEPASQGCSTHGICDPLGGLFLRFWLIRRAARRQITSNQPAIF